MLAVAEHADALKFEVSTVESIHLAAVGTMDGVIVEAVAARNGPGTGFIRYAAGALSWKAPGSATFGTPGPVPIDGSGILEDGEDPDKFIRVTVDVSELPLAGAEARVLLGDVYENDISLDDLTAAEATAGDVTAYTVDFRNASSIYLSDIRIWIDAAVSGIEISDDGATWISPTSEAAAQTFPDLAPNATDTLHIRRTIGAGASSDPKELVKLHHAFNR